MLLLPGTPVKWRRDVAVRNGPQRVGGVERAAMCGKLERAGDGRRGTRIKEMDFAQLAPTRIAGEWRVLMCGW